MLEGSLKAEPETKMLMPPEKTEKPVRNQEQEQEQADRKELTGPVCPV